MVGAAGGHGRRRAGRRAALAALLVGVLGGLPATGAAAAVTAVRLAGTGRPAASPNGTPALQASLDGPQAVAVDTAGDLAVADTGNCRVAVVAAHAQVGFGRHLQPGRVVVVAGGACSAAHGSPPLNPVGVAWDGHHGLVVVDAATDSVLAVDGGTGRTSVLAGTGRPGTPQLGAPASRSALDHPAGVAVDASGDVFIADTGDCRVLVVPTRSGTLDGQVVSAGHLYDAAGTGQCTLNDPSGPARLADLSAPVAVTLDDAGDLFITESARDDIDEVPVASGTYYGVGIGAGDIAPVVGSGSDNTFIADGLSATSSYAELNYPDGVAVDQAGNLYIADGLDRCVRVVPAHDTVLFGRAMTAGDMYTAVGALPVPLRGVAGDGTRWFGPRLVNPTGVAVSGHHLVIVDTGANQLWAVS